MRIIGGTLKGRNVVVPKDFKGRPTTDFAREGLFNVLSNLVDLNQCDVLDLFSGTGAFSLECFSRGARSLLCVENQPQHAKYIRENFRSFNVDNANVILMDAIKYIGNANERFHLVFADPPFDFPSLHLLPDMIIEKQLLQEDGLIVLEHSKKNSWKDHARFQQERKYSNVHFSFFSK